MAETLFELLLQQIQPTIDLVARELAGLAEERITAMLSKISIACQQALSLAASEINLEGGADVDEIEIGPIAVVHRDPKPATAARSSVGDSARAIAKVARPSVQPPPAKVPGRVTCKKCGFVGGNARGCGTAHPTQRASAMANGAVQDSGRTPPPAQPRVSTIAARVYNRAKQAAAPSITEADDDAAPEDDVPLADKIAEAEGGKAEGELPEPSSSWEVDGDVVLRVGAGGTAAEIGARRMCGICGVRGHNAQRCPRRDESESELDFEADA